MTLLAPRIENEVSYVTQISADIHFVWQAQHFVTFWEIAGARNVVFYKNRLQDGKSKVPEAAGAR